jgi:hypothetical protein
MPHIPAGPHGVLSLTLPINQPPRPPPIDPMIDANPPLLAVAPAPTGGTSRRSDRMLAELLALNEEMIVQLRLERLSAVGTTDFIAVMIDQHELAAKRLRTQLDGYESRAAHARSRARGISLGNPLTG